MSSPCMGPRVVRCRVRELASCFYACRLPLEEEPETLYRKSPEMSTGGIVFDSKGDGGGDRATGNKSLPKNIMSKEDGGGSVQSSSGKNRKTGLKDGNLHQAEPRFAEEDYIVFCFREDGAIHMINEGSKSSSEASYDSENDEDGIIKTASATLRSISSKVGNGKGSKETDTEWPPDDEIREIKHVKQPNPSKMKSLESCDSNLSDTSTSSFAFPVLGIEWIGSPVHMPKSETWDDQSVRLRCCRF